MNFHLTKKEAKHSNPAIYPAEQILSYADKQPQDIITGLIRQGEQVMVFSAPGAGKSWFALSLALAAACGTSVAKTAEGDLKWKAPKPRKVLVVDGELDVADLSSRLKGLTVGRPQPKELFFFPRQLQVFDAKFPNLAEDQDAEDLVKHCIDNQIDLLVLDNLTTLAAVQDENSTSAFKPVIDGLLMRLKAANVACLLVHHSNKGDSSFRGSSAIATTFNAIMHLKKNPMVKGEFTLTFTKARNDHIQNQALTMQLTTAANGSMGLLCNSEVSKYEQIAYLVRSLDYTTDAEVRHALASQLGQDEVLEGTFSKWKKASIRDGFITVSDWKRCLEEAEGFLAFEPL